MASAAAGLGCQRTTGTSPVVCVEPSPGLLLTGGVGVGVGLVSLLVGVSLNRAPTTVHEDRELAETINQKRRER